MKCCICGKHITNGLVDSKGNYYCSEECANMSLPKCCICGKPIRNGLTDDKGNCYCSQECYTKSLPTCYICGKHMENWLETNNGEKYCNETCYNNHKNNKLKIEMKSPMSSKELAYITGLSNEECENFMKLNKIDGDEALELIDIFMESLNNNIVAPVEVTSCLYNAGIYIKLAERLSKYNTMRGGVKGYGGFIFEELHAADVASKGANITVLNDNGIADFIVKDANGKEILVQAKAGYKPNTIDWNKYKGQTIVVDKGNSALANEAKRAGLKVQESNIFKKEADLVARTQQLESKLTGRVTAPITGTMASAHYAGLASAKLAARIGVSMKIGENIYDIISGEKSFEEAAGNIVKDSVVLVGGAYIGGAALTITGTALGMTATAIAGTSIGAATIGTVGAATAAIGGTAVGGMIISGVGTVAAGTATIVSSIAAAPLLPVVTGFAVLGCAFKWFKSK